MFLDGLLRRPLEARGLLAVRVPDDFVHVGVQVVGERAEFRPRAASSGVHENSPRIVPGVDLSYASTTLASETDLLPYSSRMRWSFGRLMPTGVTGPESPSRR